MRGGGREAEGESRGESEGGEAARHGPAADAAAGPAPCAASTAAATLQRPRGEGVFVGRPRVLRYSNKTVSLIFMKGRLDKHVAIARAPLYFVRRYSPFPGFTQVGTLQ